MIGLSGNGFRLSMNFGPILITNIKYTARIVTIGHGLLIKSHCSASLPEK